MRSRRPMTPSFPVWGDGSAQRDAFWKCSAFKLGNGEAGNASIFGKIHHGLVYVHLSSLIGNLRCKSHQTEWSCDFLLEVEICLGKSGFMALWQGRRRTSASPFMASWSLFDLSNFPMFRCGSSLKMVCPILYIDSYHDFLNHGGLVCPAFEQGEIFIWFWAFVWGTSCTQGRSYKGN